MSMLSENPRSKSERESCWPCFVLVNRQPQTGVEQLNRQLAVLYPNAKSMECDASKLQEVVVKAQQCSQAVVVLLLNQSMADTVLQYCVSVLQQLRVGYVIHPQDSQIASEAVAKTREEVVQRIHRLLKQSKESSNQLQSQLTASKQSTGEQAPTNLGVVLLKTTDTAAQQAFYKLWERISRTKIQAQFYEIPSLDKFVPAKVHPSWLLVINANELYQNAEVLRTIAKSSRVYIVLYDKHGRSNHTDCGIKTVISQPSEIEGVVKQQLEQLALTNGKPRRSSAAATLLRTPSTTRRSSASLNKTNIQFEDSRKKRASMIKQTKLLKQEQVEVFVLQSHNEKFKQFARELQVPHGMLRKIEDGFARKTIIIGCYEDRMQLMRLLKMEYRTFRMVLFSTERQPPKYVNHPLVDLTTNSINELLNYFSEHRIKGTSANQYFGLKSMRSMKSMKSLRHIRDGRQKATKSDLQPNNRVNFSEVAQQQPQQCYFRSEYNQMPGDHSNLQLQGKKMELQQQHSNHTEYHGSQNRPPAQKSVQPLRRPSNVKVQQNRHSLMDLPYSNSKQPRHQQALSLIQTPPVNKYNELTNINMNLLQDSSLKSVQSMSNLMATPKSNPSHAQIKNILTGGSTIHRPSLEDSIVARHSKDQSQLSLQPSKVAVRSIITSENMGKKDQLDVSIIDFDELSSIHTETSEVLGGGGRESDLRLDEVKEYIQHLNHQVGERPSVAAVSSLSLQPASGRSFDVREQPSEIPVQSFIKPSELRSTCVEENTVTSEPARTPAPSIREEPESLVQVKMIRRGNKYPTIHQEECESEMEQSRPTSGNPNLKPNDYSMYSSKVGSRPPSSSSYQTINKVGENSHENQPGSILKKATQPAQQQPIAKHAPKKQSTRNTSFVARPAAEAVPQPSKIAAPITGVLPLAKPSVPKHEPSYVAYGAPVRVVKSNSQTIPHSIYHELNAGVTAQGTSPKADNRFHSQLIQKPLPYQIRHVNGVEVYSWRGQRPTLRSSVFVNEQIEQQPTGRHSQFCRQHSTEPSTLTINQKHQQQSDDTKRSHSLMVKPQLHFPTVTVTPPKQQADMRQPSELQTHSFTHHRQQETACQQPSPLICQPSRLSRQPSKIVVSSLTSASNDMATIVKPPTKQQARSRSQVTARSIIRPSRPSHRYSVQIAFQTSQPSICDLSEYFQKYPSKLLEFNSREELQSIFKNNVADCSLNLFVVDESGLNWLRQVLRQHRSSSNIIACLVDCPQEVVMPIQTKLLKSTDNKNRFQELSQFIRQEKMKMFDAPDFEDYNLHSDSPVNIVNLYFQDSKGLARVHNSLSRHFNGQFSWYKYGSPLHLVDRLQRLGHRQFDIVIASSPREILNALTDSHLLTDRLAVYHFSQHPTITHPNILHCPSDRSMFDQLLQVFAQFTQLPPQ